MDQALDSDAFRDEDVLTIVKRLGQEISADWFFAGCESAIKTQKLNREQLSALIDFARETLDDNAFSKIEALAWDHGFRGNDRVIDDAYGTALDRTLSQSVGILAIESTVEDLVSPKGCCVVS